MPDLSGKVALVTGGTKGIGRAVVKALREAGAAVALSARTASDVEDVAEDLAAAGGPDVVGIACDVRDADACRSLVAETVDRLGRLDILVNNAGVGRFAPVGEMSDEDWAAVIETNLNGVFYLTKAAIPHLASSDDGWIINIGSLAGRNPFAGGTAYNTSKFGLVGLTEATMLDVRHDGIRVSIIMPGSVDTHFAGRDPENNARDWAQRPEDVALAVVSLLEQPSRTHVSRVEMRPSQPPKK